MGKLINEEGFKKAIDMIYNDLGNLLKKITDTIKSVDEKEPKITKKTGFNKEKSDSVTTDSSIILATTKAIKTVWDTLTTHRNSINNPHVVTKSQIGLGSVPNYTITDSTTDGSSLKFGSAKAIKTVWDKTLEMLGLTNTNKNAIQNNTEQIENLLEEKIIFDGSVTSGEVTLSENWNNFRTVVVISDVITFGNTEQRHLLTSQIVSSDETGVHGGSENTFISLGEHIISGRFRSTDKTKLYITERSGAARMKKVIGVGRIV